MEANLSGIAAVWPTVFRRVLFVSQGLYPRRFYP